MFRTALGRTGVIVFTFVTAMMLFAVPAFATPPEEGCFRIEVLVDGSLDGISWTFNGDESVTVTGPVASVKVKGGPDFDGAFYDTPPFENLTAPINPNNGTPYGISHVDICPGEDPPDVMCLEIPVGYPGTTTVGTVNGATATVTWNADGFSWTWTGDFDPRMVKIGVRVSERSREDVILYGASGTYVGPVLGLRVCHCPRTR